MKPTIHIIVGAIASLILWYLLPVMAFPGFLIVFLASVLIDFDHYLSYVVMKGRFSVSEAYKFFTNEDELSKMSRHYSAPLNIFHTAEFLVLLIILSWNTKFFFLVWVGCFIHYLIDGYETFIVNKNPSARQYSIILFLIKKYF